MIMDTRAELLFEIDAIAWHIKRMAKDNHFCQMFGRPLLWSIEDFLKAEQNYQAAERKLMEFDGQKVEASP